jgi:ribosomal protein L7/L12
LKIISRNYDGIDVVFDNLNSLYINATKIAKHFKKLPADWLRLKDTKAYIEAISRYGNPHNDELVVVKQGGNAQEQGTWIHKKLIISFARWLSPDFAVWCDGVIEEILQTGSYSVEKPFSKKEEIEIEYFALEKSMDILRVNEASKIKMIRTFHEAKNLETSYLPEYSDENHTYSLSHLLKKFDVKMSAQKFNKLLISAGFLEIKTRKSSKYRTEKDENGNEKKIQILKTFKSLTEKGLEFGKNMISEKNQLETQPHYFENKFSELLKILEIQ